MRKPVVLIASDSFKDALTSLEVCRAIEGGVLDASSEVETRIFPLGDGGEGTAESLIWHLGGEMVSVEVHDPLFRCIEAKYGLLGDGKTAVIEMASASGLQLLEREMRNPLNTTTYGTGELILDAIKRGVTHLIICIGGSATHDCGIGMATALGYAFLDADGQQVSPTGGNLEKIVQIDGSCILSACAQISVEVWCDVDNPLIGPMGAARVYAPQKGADEVAVGILEKGTRNFSFVLEEFFGGSFAEIPGSGAAGGMGAGIMAFLGGKIVAGSEAVLKMTNFEAALYQADIIFTGEGRLDGQTRRGKLIKAIGNLANRNCRPVLALCGTIDAGRVELDNLGVTAAISIQSGPCDLEHALRQSSLHLQDAAFAAVRIWEAGRKYG
jgi:glycerate kinase